MSAILVDSNPVNAAHSPAERKFSVDSSSFSGILFSFFSVKFSPVLLPALLVGAYFQPFFAFAFAIFFFVLFLHEAGHAFLIKKQKLTLEVFSLGIGPLLVSFSYKGTNFALRLLPVAAYVKMKEFAAEPLCHSSKVSPIVRLKVIFAGPFVNIFTGLLAAFLVFLLAPQTVSTNLEFVISNAKAGVSLQNGDVLTLPSDPAKHLSDRSILSTPPAGSVEIIRGGKHMFVPFSDPIGADGKRDFTASLTAPKTTASFEKALFETGVLTLHSFKEQYDGAMRRFHSDSLITGFGTVARLVLAFSIISLMVGFLNLLPIPPFDGGAAIMLGYERIVSTPSRASWIPAATVAKWASFAGVGLLLYFGLLQPILLILFRS